MFGSILKSLRLNNKLTQKELGEKLNISQRVVGYYEKGQRFPDYDTLLRIADFFEVSIDDLLRDSSVLLINKNLSNVNLKQPISRVNRQYKLLDAPSIPVIHDTDSLMKVIQRLLDKASGTDNFYLLKQILLLIFNQLDTCNLIDQNKDTDLIEIRNYLAHSAPSDKELKEFLNLYSNKK